MSRDLTPSLRRFGELLLGGGMEWIDRDCFGEENSHLAAALGNMRVGCNVQSIYAADDVEDILYDECFATLTGADGRIYCAGDFIPKLEAAGEVAPFDRKILSVVLKHLELNPYAVLGCNLSGDNFSNLDSRNAVKSQILSRPDLASRLVLEVTETQRLNELPAASAMLTELKEVGCRIALDDCGAGYATPSLLQVLDFDIVKIDRSFVGAIRPSKRGGNSLLHIIGFAACYTSTIVVEGIETEEQALVARIAGATHLQGFLFPRPVPLAFP
ncbi:EAL domain-containing protein [Ochrobactrum soli]|nr:EAL domain-containing protein [[Ochrobactrum] soli]